MEENVFKMTTILQSYIDTFVLFCFSKMCCKILLEMMKISIKHQESAVNTHGNSIHTSASSFSSAEDDSSPSSSPSL